MSPYRNLQSPEARAAHARAKRRWRAKRGVAERPFVGVDGEGAGTDELGRQVYRLLRAGDDVLWRKGRGLEPEECLDFLARLDPTSIYVGYYFDYDATQILRGLPAERLYRLFVRPEGRQHWIDWKDWQVDYLPHKYLRVRRKAKGARWITVNDVGSFFQCSFVRALERWQIGTPAEREEVRKGKLRRGGESLSAEDRCYNALEVKLLAAMMEEVREVAREIDYLPSRWQGPGGLAEAMLRRHGIAKRQEKSLPAEVVAFAEEAYYGGRFEVTAVGQVPGPVYEYDLNSAYPHAMLSLPCLVHGRWGKTTRPTEDVWVGRVRFEHPGAGSLCHLPVRSREGVISWPRSGGGTYWSVEIEAARRASAEVAIGTCWQYHPDCDCQPFDWIPAVYAERLRLGKSTRGGTLKLALNSPYGKFAQRVGAAPYRSTVWAGLVTATTRARLVELYREAKPGSVVMLATDGVYTREKLSLVTDPNALGAWSETVFEDGIFIVQPGLWWSRTKLRTRGISATFFGPHRERFERALAGRWRVPPVVQVPAILFVGLKLAIARNAPETAGMWKKINREISFDWSGKRGTGKRSGSLVTTVPREGGWGSVPYRLTLPNLVEAERSREELEAQPDFVELLGE